MNRTAINNPKYKDSISSIFADVSISTSASPESMATRMLGIPLCFPWETVSEPISEKSYTHEIETIIEISAKTFEYFTETINNPPKANPNLIQLMSP